MMRFTDVVVTAALQQIMEQNTVFYRDDFITDKDVLKRAAKSSNPENKTLLWLSRACGTLCVRERDVFVKGTGQHTAWTYYGAQENDHVIAYAIELDADDPRGLIGTVYELDYAAHLERVRQYAQEPKNIRLRYQHGSKDVSPDTRIDNYDDSLGVLLDYEYCPEDQEALRKALCQERRERRRNTIPGNVDAHIRNLITDRIEREARRIARTLAELDKPNAPIAGCYMARVSGDFVTLAELSVDELSMHPPLRRRGPGADYDRLLALLPYEHAGLYYGNDPRGVYVLVSSNEIRDEDQMLRGSEEPPWE